MSQFERKNYDEILYFLHRRSPSTHFLGSINLNFMEIDLFAKIIGSKFRYLANIKVQFLKLNIQNYFKTEHKNFHK